MSDGRARRWDDVYAGRDPIETSWFEDAPTVCGRPGEEPEPAWSAVLTRDPAGVR